jgi:hypothetical protein
MTISQLLTWMILLHSRFLRHELVKVVFPTYQIEMRNVWRFKA